MRRLSLVLLVACSGAPSPPVTAPAPVVEVRVAPPSPDAGAAPPVRAMPVEDAVAFSLTAAPSGAFAGAAGNVPGDSGITGVWAASSRVFAVGNELVLRSTDRGLHFSKAALPLRFPVVWSVGDDVYIGGEGGVVHSSDGGATFTELPQKSMMGVGGVGRSAVQGIWGRSADEVYVAGGGGTPFVLKSTDRGATWTRLPIPVFDGWLYGITSTDASDIIVTGVDRGGKYSIVLLRSTNGGKTFERMPGFKTGNDNEESRAACFTSGVLFVSSTYALYATRDLGKTWKQSTKLGGEVLALACRGRDVIVGGRGRELAISRDLGVTWTKDPLASLFTSEMRVSVQAAAIADTGEAYIGYEGLYDDKHGTLFRRTP